MSFRPVIIFTMGGDGSTCIVRTILTIDSCRQLWGAAVDSVMLRAEGPRLNTDLLGEGCCYGLDLRSGFKVTVKVIRLT